MAASSTALPGLKFPVLVAETSIVDLQPGPLPGQAVQGLPNIGQFLLVQPPHVAHLPAFGFLLLLELHQQERPLTFQVLDALDVVGEAVVEVPQVTLLLDAGQTSGAGGAAAGAAGGAGGLGGGGDGGHGDGCGWTLVQTGPAARTFGEIKIKGAATQIKTDSVKGRTSKSFLRDQLLDY